MSNVDERRTDAAGMPGRAKAWIASSAIRAASRSRSTTPSTTTPSATCWCGTKRTRPSRPKGYARATGKVGVCCATSGPGATNLVTGLVDAMMDSIPIVAHHRPGLHQADRQRRLPGSRHVRHHALLHQAQFPGEEHRRPAADRSTKRSTSPPAAGPGPVLVDITEGRLPGPGALPAGDLHPPARLQGLHRRPHRPDPPRRADDLGSRAAAGVRRRRHHRGRARRRNCASSWNCRTRPRSAR